MNLPDWTATAADYAQAYAPHIAAGAGAVGMLLATYAIRRFTKNREHDDLAANLGVVLFGVVTTEGMWEVVHNKLGVNIGLTVAMFAAFDVVIYSQGRLAIRKLTSNPKARVGTYLTIIWALSIAAALTVSTAGGNITTQLFRFFSPMVAAALWTQKVLELRTGTVERTESNWIWTPDRLMVRWGWKKPGAVDDLSDVFAQRRIAALVDAGLELHAQQKAAEGREPVKSSRWRRREDPLVAARRRVQRLTKAATPADVEAARRQIRLTLSAERELFRQEDDLDERGRQTLDDVRLIMRQATDKLRGEHARAFGPDHREPMVEIGGIRMPAHIAAQIPPMPEPRPAHRDGSHESLAEVVREPAVDSPRAAAATQRPAQRRITEKVGGESTAADDKKLRQAYSRLTKKLGREPSGVELGEAAGVSKATANRWKANHVPKES